jgi:hypothetical protein
MEIIIGILGTAPALSNRHSHTIDSGATLSTLYDVGGAVITGASFQMVSGNINGTTIGAGNNAGSGAASWVLPWMNASAGFLPTWPTKNQYRYLGLPAGDYIIETYGIASTGTGELRSTVNDAEELFHLAGGGNLTLTNSHAAVAAGVGGVINFQVGQSAGTSNIAAIRIVSVAAADTTAPTFNTAPAVTDTSETGHTIASTLNEGGTLYGVRLASGATAPSSPQVVAGQNNTGAAALEAVSVAATAATIADLTFSTGAASTAYDYYMVAQDDEGTPNLQAAPTLVSATTAAAAVPGIGQLTVQFEGVAINVADWHIITRLAADQSILYNQTGQSSDASGNIAAFATTSGSVGDPVRVEGLSAADAYSFVIEQNLGNIA